MPPWVVFTDLDGTLLSHEGYDWAPAQPALEALRARDIPLVFTSSKTRAEIELWRDRIGNRDPFVSENGGALWIPDRPPWIVPDDADRGEEPACVAFGTPIARVRRALAEIADELGLPLRGFGAMEEAEVAALTGLPEEQAARALVREFDEPFVAGRPLTATEEVAIERAAHARGLRVTRGSRFHHLLGPHDKARAARRLLAALPAAPGSVRTAGLGDGANDLELLAAVDRAIVVARPDGTHAQALRTALPGARFTHAPGPAGFAEGVLGLLAADQG